METSSTTTSGAGQPRHHVDRRDPGTPRRERREELLVMVDLAACDRMRKRYPLFWENPVSKSPDWRLKLYQKMLQTIEEKTDLGK